MYGKRLGGPAQENRSDYQNVVTKTLPVGRRVHGVYGEYGILCLATCMFFILELGSWSQHFLTNVRRSEFYVVFANKIQ